MESWKSGMFKLRMTFALTILTLTVLATPSLAQQESRDITLPRQPLAESLTAVGKAFGLSIVAPGDLVRDRTAPAISGDYTADRAVSELIAGAGLEASHSSSGTIIIRDAAAPADSASTEDAASRSDTGLRLAPVVVTGERTERTLFDTASSASVITGEELDNMPGIGDVDELLNYIPNVDMGGHSNEGPTIRGIKAGGPLSGVYSFYGGSRPRATITVDGRALSASEFIFGTTSLWDVSRVEVFRGPQTTTQGVNSIAGAIHVVTEDPTMENHVRARVEVGDYRHARVSAAASGPIVDDELAILLSLDMQRMDTALAMHPTDDYGPDPNTFLNGVMRGKLLWTPSALPELKMKLTVNSSRAEAPQAEYVQTKDKHDLIPISVNMPTHRVTSTTGIYDVSYDFSDSLSLSNRFAYADVEDKRYVPVANQGAARTEKDEISNETTLNWKNTEAGLSGLVGVFYQRADSDESLNYRLSGVGSFDDLQTSLGLYTEATYDITSKLDLTLGLRYQSDTQDRTGTMRGGTSYTVDMDYDKTFDALLPKVVLGYDVTDDFRVGAMASKGFNPGGVTVLWNDGTENTFDEETVWNYELFGRLKALDDRLTVNGNLFYADYSDYQLNYFAGTFGTSVVYGIANADEAVSYGLELSADYLATEQLRLHAGLGLLHTEIEKFDDANGLDVEGAAFMRSPEVTASLGADYTILEALTLGGRIRYVGEYKSEDTNDSIKAGDYFVCDVTASYDLDPFAVYGYVNNVFDEFYTVSELSIGRAIVGDRREAGFGVKYSF